MRNSFFPICSSILIAFPCILIDINCVMEHKLVGISVLGMTPHKWS